MSHHEHDPMKATITPLTHLQGGWDALALVIWRVVRRTTSRDYEYECSGPGYSPRATSSL